MVEYTITEDDDGVWLRVKATGELCGPYGSREEAIADLRDELEVKDWAGKLARGDGRGLVPKEVAKKMYDAGLLEYEPKNIRHYLKAVMVRLKKQEG